MNLHFTRAHSLISEEPSFNSKTAWLQISIPICEWMNAQEAVQRLSLNHSDSLLTPWIICRWLEHREQTRELYEVLTFNQVQPVILLRKKKVFGWTPTSALCERLTGKHTLWPKKNQTSNYVTIYLLLVMHVYESYSMHFA